jgi:hypothetical protein
MTNQTLIQAPIPAVKKSAKAKALAVPQYLRDSEKFTSPGDVEQAVTRYLSALGTAGLCVQALRGMVGSTDPEVVKEFLLPHVGRYYGVPTRTTGSGKVILMSPAKDDVERGKAYETARKRLNRLAEEVCEVAEAKAPDALPEASEGEEKGEEVAEPTSELISAMLALIEAHQVGKKTASKALAKAFSTLKGAATAALK